MAVAVSFGLIARRADQAPFCRSEPRIVETVRRRRVRLVERPRLGDRADGNFSQLVGGVEAEGDAVDLCHLGCAALRRAPRRRITSGVCSAALKQSQPCRAVVGAQSAGLPGSAGRALRNNGSFAAMRKKALLLLAVLILVWLYASLFFWNLPTNNSHKSTFRDLTVGYRTASQHQPLSKLEPSCRGSPQHGAGSRSSGPRDMQIPRRG